MKNLKKDNPNLENTLTKIYNSLMNNVYGGWKERYGYFNCKDVGSWKNIGDESSPKISVDSPKNYLRIALDNNKGFHGYEDFSVKINDNSIDFEYFGLYDNAVNNFINLKKCIDQNKNIDGYVKEYNNHIKNSEVLSFFKKEIEDTYNNKILEGLEPNPLLDYAESFMERGFEPTHYKKDWEMSEEGSRELADDSVDCETYLSKESGLVSNIDSEDLLCYHKESNEESPESWSTLTKLNYTKKIKSKKDHKEIEKPFEFFCALFKNKLKYS